MIKEHPLHPAAHAAARLRLTVVPNSRGTFKDIHEVPVGHAFAFPGPDVERTGYRMSTESFAVAGEYQTWLRAAFAHEVDLLSLGPADLTYEPSQGFIVKTKSRYARQPEGVTVPYLDLLPGDLFTFTDLDPLRVRIRTDEGYLDAETWSHILCDSYRGHVRLVRPAVSIVGVPDETTSPESQTVDVVA